MLPGFDPAPATAPKHHQFNFTVTGLTTARAQALYEFIVEEATYYRANVVEIGGGFAEVTADGEAISE